MQARPPGSAQLPVEHVTDEPVLELEATNCVGSFMYESCSSGDVKRVNDFIAVNVKRILECRYFELSATDRCR